MWSAAAVPSPAAGSSAWPASARQPAFSPPGGARATTSSHFSAFRRVSTVPIAHFFPLPAVRSRPLAGRHTSAAFIDGLHPGGTRTRTRARGGGGGRLLKQCPFLPAAAAKVDLEKARLAQTVAALEISLKLKASCCCAPAQRPTQTPTQRQFTAGLTANQRQFHSPTSPECRQPAALTPRQPPPSSTRIDNRRLFCTFALLQDAKIASLSEQLERQRGQVSQPNQRDEMRAG